MSKSEGKIKRAEETRLTHAITEMRGTRAPWWMTADIEVCAVCGEGYAYGAGYHCSGCDAAVCTFCVEDRGGEFWCVEC